MLIKLRRTSNVEFRTEKVRRKVLMGLTPGVPFGLGPPCTVVDHWTLGSEFITVPDPTHVTEPPSRPPG